MEAIDDSQLWGHPVSLLAHAANNRGPSELHARGVAGPLAAISKARTVHRAVVGVVHAPENVTSVYFEEITVAAMLCRSM